MRLHRKETKERRLLMGDTALQRQWELGRWIEFKGRSSMEVLKR